MDPTQDPQGFARRLFDFSFREYVTTQILRVIYILAILMAALSALAFIGGGFAQSMLVGFVFLIISPVIFLIYVIAARVWVELIIVLFRISEDLSTLVKIQGGTPAGAKLAAGGDATPQDAPAESHESSGDDQVEGGDDSGDDPSQEQSQS